MGIGAKLKKAFSNVESGVRETAAKVRGAGARLEGGVRRGAASIRRLGAGRERLQRNIASAVKSGYTHPGTSIKREIARTGSKTEEAAKVAASQSSQITPQGQLARAAKRQIDKLAPTEEAPIPIPEPTPMPIPDEALSIVARRRQRARRKGARGSSILSGSQDTLG